MSLSQAYEEEMGASFSFERQRGWSSVEDDVVDATGETRCVIYSTSHVKIIERGRERSGRSKIIEEWRLMKLVAVFAHFPINELVLHS